MGVSDRNRWAQPSRGYTSIIAHFRQGSTQDHLMSQAGEKKTPPAPTRWGCLILFLILATVFAPCGLLLFVFGSLGAYQFIYTSRYCIENHTNQHLWITPVGKYQNGSIGILVQYLLFPPGLEVLRGKHRRVRAGRSKWFAYHRRGLETYEIVVCNEVGEYRQLVIEPAPTRESVRCSERTHCIESWDGLKPVESDTLEAVLGPDQSWELWALFLFELVVTVLDCWWLSQRG